ncbi:ImmA/IrrE family metallo-endopeptidase [Lysinibacillus sp. FSL L8-0312]|uniref:ImmA/IrrE family metallo-endopeptidase n=1 Tax=Lysinibacillus sp. FSL L8-0312 TaxID=2921521 RepID=UPI0030FA2D9C
MGVEDIVLNLIKKYKTEDPFKIAKELGIVILYHDLGNIYGYFRTYKRMPIIHINNKIDKEMQRVVCSHELGHAVLHPKINTLFFKKYTFFSTDKLELEANFFAVHLLIPNESLFDSYDQMTIFDIAALYNVPIELVELKFKGLF